MADNHHQRRQTGSAESRDPTGYPVGATGAGARPAPYLAVTEEPATAPMAAQPEAGMAALASAGVFLAGVWLVLAPYGLNYENTGTGFDGYWNDIVIGATIAIVAIVRMVTPIRTAALGLVTIALGAWLIMAPFVLGYNLGADAMAATWNDIVVGFIVVALAMTSTALGIRRR